MFKAKTTAKRTAVKSRRKRAARSVKKPAKKLKKSSVRKAPQRTVRKVKKKPLRKPPKKTGKKASKSQKSKPQEKPIGVVTHWFGKISVGVIKLKSDLNVGDKIRIKGAHDEFVQRVNSMQVEHKDVARAVKGMEVGMKVARRVHENNRVYRA